MREMKDSGVAWIGEIPKEWELLRIGFATSVREEKFDTGKYRYIALENIESFSGRYIETKSIYDLAGSKKAYPGDVLFGKLRPYLAKVLSITEETCVSSEFAVFEPRKVITPFLKYFCLNHRFIEAVTASTYGTKMPRANIDFIRNLKMVIPPLPAQRRIADYLDTACGKVDALIANQQAQIEKLKTYKQSLITEVVTHGLNPNAPMKDSGVEWIGMIPEGWEVVKTGRLFRENSRKPFGGDTPLSLSQIDGLVATDDMKESSLKTSSYENWKRVEIGDLVLNRFKAHLGVLFSSSLTGIVSFHYGVYEARLHLRTKYYEYLYHSDQYKAILGNASNGMVVGLQNLSNLNFYSTYSLFPPLSEQADIIAYLDAKCAKIDALIAIKQQKIEKLTQYKKSLIYEYVTGKKEVT